MKIIAYQSRIEGTCPASQLRLANHWSRAWARTGLEPFVATEWHLGGDALSKWLESAFTPQERPLSRLILSQIAHHVASPLLKAGECAYVTHYDVLPTKDYGWHREEYENLSIWEELVAFGTRRQLIGHDGATPELDPTKLPIVHLNTLELRAAICPKVTWSTDEPIEEPPTGQFGGQFRPRTRILN